MAIIKELHDSTSLEAALVSLPEIDAALEGATAQLGQNLDWISNYEYLSFGDTSAITSTAKHFSYSGDVVFNYWGLLYDPEVDFFFEDLITDSEVIELDIVGTNLPQYDEDTETWSNPSGVKITSVDLLFPTANNAEFSFAGSITYGATADTFSVTKVAIGDDNVMLELTGSLMVTDPHAVGAATTASGTIKSIQIKVLKDAGTSVIGDEIYYLAKAALNLTSKEQTITSFRVSEVGPSNSETVLFDASNLTLAFADLDTAASDFFVDTVLAGSDSIVGTSGGDTLQGGGGNDTIDGADGNDNMDGGSGNDSILGSAGDDTLEGGLGNDVINGGDDTDIAVFNLNFDQYELTENSTGFTVKAKSGSEGTDSVTNVEFYQFADQQVFVKHLTGEVGEIFVGDETDEEVSGGDDSDILDAGAGDDTVDAGAGDDSVKAGLGDDSIDAGAGNDTVIGGDGNDVIDAGEDNDVVQGDAGNDSIDGGSGNDSVSGGVGDDELTGGTGKDSILGGSGNDVLDGGTGSDRMEGGSGNDTYHVDDKKDVVYEANNTATGSGNLTLEANIGEAVDSVITSIKYTLGKYIENLTLKEGVAKLAGTGNELGNVLAGNSSDNNISGLKGDDSILGVAGKDTLLGGDGNDTLNGGADADKMTGGNGSDIFVIGDIPSSVKAFDSITDFAEVDTIYLDTALFVGLADGVTEANFYLGTAAADEGDRLIFNKKDGSLYYDEDGKGGTEQVKIVAIKGKDTAIDYTDFGITT